MADNGGHVIPETMPEEFRIHHEIVARVRDVAAHIARVEGKSSRDATETLLIFSLIVASNDLELEMSDMRKYVEMLIDRMLWERTGTGTRH